MILLSVEANLSGAGSMHDVPKELMDTIHELERLFTVDVNKMHTVTSRFVSELEKGAATPPPHTCKFSTGAQY